MPMIHISHTRKLVLASEEGVAFGLYLVNDIDLHSDGNITMTLLQNLNKAQSHTNNAYT